MTDTLFADVSEFQTPVDDTYPYQVLSIRSNDGTYRDGHFASNYQWCVRACDSGKLTCFIVYCYWRANWDQTARTMMDMVNAQGGPHPRMIAMIDLESGGNPGGDQSAGANGMYNELAAWLGNDKRVIGYANLGDERTMWQAKPADLEMILAGYGSNPTDPGVQKLAHQYTDGQGYGGGLPEGASPFGKCDMNSADGLSPEEFAAACGVGTTTGGPTVTTPNTNTPPPVPDPGSTDGRVWDIWQQLFGVAGRRWPQLGDRTLVDAVAELLNRIPPKA